MTDIAELLERVKAATGPDREIDLLICAHVEQAGQWAEGDIQYALSDIERTTGPKPYTASIDAALALTERVLPEGADLVLKFQTRGKFFHAELETEEGDEFVAYNHPTLPLAILAATLSAITRATGETP